MWKCRICGGVTAPSQGPLPGCLSLRSANISHSLGPSGLKPTPHANPTTHLGAKKMGSSFICQDPAPPPMESALMASGGLGEEPLQQWIWQGPFFFHILWQFSPGGWNVVNPGILSGDLEDVLKVLDML